MMNKIAFFLSRREKHLEGVISLEWRDKHSTLSHLFPRSPHALQEASKLDKSGVWKNSFSIYLVPRLVSSYISLFMAGLQFL